jgi:hypothetical protein
MTPLTTLFKIFTVLQCEICEGITLEAIWHGGSGVNIYIGGKEVDYISETSLKSNEDFQRFVAEYIIRFVQTLKEDLNHGDTAA